MQKQDFILLIMNCKKYEYKAQKQKETWLKNLPDFLIYFHVIGDPTLCTDFEFNYSKNILVLI
jgi:hypothetical protein